MTIFPYEILGLIEIRELQMKISKDEKSTQDFYFWTIQKDCALFAIILFSRLYVRSELGS